MTLTSLDLAIGLLIVAVLIGAVVLMLRRRRSAKLRDHYGSEYDHSLARAGSTARAEAELRERERRTAAYAIHPLTPAQRQGFIEHWQVVQTKFVDDPHGAVMRADVLLTEIMEARGYPMADFEQRAADLSVDHAHVVENYRAGRALVLRGDRGESGTEDMRQAMLHYRALFDDLVNEPDNGQVADYRVHMHPTPR